MLVQLVGEEAEQHVLGLAEVEPCCDEHPADPAPARGQRTQTPAAAAVTVPINLMVTEQLSDLCNPELRHISDDSTAAAD